MVQIKRLIYLFLILSIFTVQAFASGQNRAGTSAAPELRIPVGARFLAMSGASIASVNGLESIYWNPAGVDVVNTSASALFSSRSYIADMTMNFIAVSGKIGGLGSIGLSFRNLNIGDINVTTLNQPDGTGAKFSPTNFVIGLTYSKQLTDRISVGVNFNLINESFDRANASGLGFDIGVQYRDLFSVKDLDLGVVVKNLGGSMTYGGNALFVNAEDPSSSRGPTWYKFDAASANLPSEISIGLSYKGQIDEKNSVYFATSFQNNNYTYDNYRVGFEYSYDDIFFVRAGYTFTPQSTNNTPYIFEDYTLGAGFNLKKLSNFDLSVDYAYVPAQYFSANNVFSIRVGF